MTIHPTATAMIVIVLTISQVTINNHLTGDAAWYANEFLLIVQSFAALCLLWAAIPYKALFTKTVVAIWAAAVCSEMIIYPLWVIHSDLASYAMTCSTVIMSLSFLYVNTKSYTRVTSDIIRPGYIYQVRAVPKNLQDLIISIISLHPYGGTGVICDGWWYHYRHGKLVRDPLGMIPVKKCVILETRIEKPADRVALRGRIGDSWTWAKNCMTVLHPFARMGRFLL